MYPTEQRFAKNTIQQCLSLIVSYIKRFYSRCCHHGWHKPLLGSLSIANWFLYLQIKNLLWNILQECNKKQNNLSKGKRILSLHMLIKRVRTKELFFESMKVNKKALIRTEMQACVCLCAMVHKLHHQLSPSDQTASLETPICVCVSKCVCECGPDGHLRGVFWNIQTLVASRHVSFLSLSHILSPSHTRMHIETQHFFWSVKQLAVSSFPIPSFLQIWAFSAFK